MPVYESYCAACRRAYERYEKHFVTTDPACPNCQAQTTRMASRFAAVFTGEITPRYKDRDKPGAYDTGHWAYRRNTPDGKVQPVRIESWQQQREFCRSEKLRDPGEVSSNATISEDGTKVTAQGMPGQWI